MAMNEQHEIIRLVYEAKDDNTIANRLVEQYLPFIKAETAKQSGRIYGDEQDDKVSIAMFAFYESILSYDKSKGAFLAYAARAIRNRLIDFYRKEQRHMGNVSLDIPNNRENGHSLAETLDTGGDEVAERIERNSAREEILHFTAQLAEFGLSMTDIADNCPKQERTLAACHRVLAYAKETPHIFDSLLNTKKLPISQLAEGAGVDKKTLERHRKYIVAILLAYTNGFEIIRGHIRQTAPRKGGLA